MIKIDMKISTTWLESRLDYKNLRDNKDINIIEDEEVWLPRYSFTNANFPDTFRRTVNTLVIKTSQPRPDDPARPVPDEIYPGSSNPLQHTELVNAKFNCDMDLLN